MTEVCHLDPRTLTPNPFNSNRVSPENMRKLARSIKDLGFITAVVCRELPDGSLQILGGQHRVETAVDMGLKSVPVINVGRIDDVKAKKIGLVDNARYGSDDTISLARIFEDIGLSSEALAELLPFSQQDFDTISHAVDIDLDALDMMNGDDAEPIDLDEVRAPKPPRTHEVMKFRLAMGDAERVRLLVEKTLKAEGLSDEDELTAAGSALAFLLLNSTNAS
jgi:ParB family chromosome partitioning protein